jgi:hypothetical protein
VVIKQKDTKGWKQFSVLLPAGEKKRLEDAAYKMRTSMALLTRKFIKEGLERLDT